MEHTDHTDTGFIPENEAADLETMRDRRSIDVELIDGEKHTIELRRLPWTNDLATKTREQMSAVVGNLEAELRLWIAPRDRHLIGRLSSKSYYTLIREGRALNDFFASHVEAQGLIIGALTKMGG